MKDKFPLILNPGQARPIIDFQIAQKTHQNRTGLKQRRALDAAESGSSFGGGLWEVENEYKQLFFSVLLVLGFVSIGFTGLGL